LVGNLYTSGEKAGPGGKAPNPSGTATMLPTPLAVSQKQEAEAQREAQAQELARVITAALADDILKVARLLVSTDERHTFGQTEFNLRDAVLAMGAKALQASLAQKKTATGARG